MTRDDWLEMTQTIRAHWPRHAIDPASLADWYRDVASLPADLGRTALDSLRAETFPPSGAQIAQRARELLAAAAGDGLTPDQRLERDKKTREVMESYRTNIAGGEVMGERYLEPEDVNRLCAEQEPIVRRRIERAIRSTARSPRR